MSVHAIRVSVTMESLPQCSSTFKLQVQVLCWFSVPCLLILPLNGFVLPFRTAWAS